MIDETTVNLILFWLDLMSIRNGIIWILFWHRSVRAISPYFLHVLVFDEVCFVNSTARQKRKGKRKKRKNSQLIIIIIMNRVNEKKQTIDNVLAISACWTLTKLFDWLIATNKRNDWISIRNRQRLRIQAELLIISRSGSHRRRNAHSLPNSKYWPRIDWSNMRT